MKTQIKSDFKKDRIHISVVMPCLNEAETIGLCIQKIQNMFGKMNDSGEIIVSDNGSTDGSVAIAESMGAKVVHEIQKGYGNAYLRGIAAARGQYIIIGDSDNTYDFSGMDKFIQLLKDGYDFVIGNRFLGKIHKGAMPFHHRYIGSPILSKILNILFKSNVGDAHCGMRAFTRIAFDRMNLEAGGMEFASEMIIKAAKSGLKMKEIPIDYYPRPDMSGSKLRSFRDGWRHLRFMLLYSPTWLFLIPGLVFMGIGLAFLLALVWGPIQIADIFLDFHFMILGSLMSILGIQVILTGLFAKVFSITHQLEPVSQLPVKFILHFTLERGVITGVILFIGGLIINLYILIVWLSSGFQGHLFIRQAILAMTFMVIGTQIIFSSFFFSFLGIEKCRQTLQNRLNS